MNISERLRDLRTEKYKITLRELSEGTGISLPYLSEIERGVSQPTITTIEKISKFYKLTLSDILSDVEAGQGKEEINMKLLPEGLVELIKDKSFKNFFDGEGGREWIKTLQRVEHRGNRPKTKEDWAALLLYLKNILNDK